MGNEKSRFVIADGGDAAIERMIFNRHIDYESFKDIVRRKWFDAPAGDYADASAWFQATLEYLWLNGYTITEREAATVLPFKK